MVLVMSMGTIRKLEINGASGAHTLTEQPDPNNFRLHTHPRAEIFYFIRGGGIFHIEGSAYPLEPGDLVVMQPAESHYIELDCTQPYERIMIHFDMSVLEPVDPQGMLLSPLLNRPPGKQNVYKSFQFRGGSSEHYFETILSPEPDPRVSLFAGLVPLLHELRAIQSCQAREPEVAADTVAYRILRYLNDNLTKAITLQDVCRQFFISRSQLCRIFREATGVTVKHYLTVKRLVYARQRIEAGEGATHVYLECGFNDYSSLYRAYMKYFGTAPSNVSPRNRGESVQRKGNHL